MATSKIPTSAPGLKLSRRIWRVLSDAGIYAPARVTLEPQQLANRYVVRGIEAGGAVEALGHYVTFADSGGQPLPYLYPLDALSPNGVHAVVVAPTLVRVEVFRIGHTYQVLVTKHSPSQQKDGRKPGLRTVEIFRSSDGYLNLDLWGKDKNRAGSVLPELYTTSGEAMEVFEALEPVLLAAVRGACCIGCRHSHYLVADRSPACQPDGRSSTVLPLTAPRAQEAVQ